jgi:hypothetical protein
MTQKWQRHLIIILGGFLALLGMSFASCQITETAHSACQNAPPSSWDQNTHERVIPRHKETTLQDSCTQSSWTEIRPCPAVLETDTTPPACQSFLSEASIWVNYPIVASLQSCSDTESGCLANSSVSNIIQTHNAHGIVSVRDRAGNVQNCTQSVDVSQIDRLAPEVSAIKITSSSGSPLAQNTWVTWESGLSHEISLAAAEEYHVQIIVADQAATAQDGSSGIDGNSTGIIITNAQGDRLIDQAINTLSTTYFASSSVTGGLEFTFVAEDAASPFHFLTEAGFYRFAFLISDSAGNITPVLNYNLQITPANPEDYTFIPIGRTLDGLNYTNNNCDGLLADMQSGCRFSLSLRDRFDNVIGTQGSTRNTGSGISACSINFVEKSMSPPTSLSITQWDNTPFGYDANKQVYLEWSCPISSSGAQLSCDNYGFIPEFNLPNGSYPLFWDNITSDASLTCSAAPFSDEQIFSASSQSATLTLPQSCRYDFFNGFLCLDAIIPF